MAYYTDKSGQTRSNLPATRSGATLARLRAPLGAEQGPEMPQHLNPRQFRSGLKSHTISVLQAVSDAQQRGVAFRSKGGWSQALRYTLGAPALSPQAGQMYKAQVLGDIVRRGSD